MSLTFPVKVYTYEKGSDYYDMTEDEMESKCCIYGCAMYFSNSIPKDEFRWIDEQHVILDDIMNYECCAWWTWSQEHLIALYKNPNIRDYRKQYILEHITY
jgi:hypothetical protein